MTKFLNYLPVKSTVFLLCLIGFIPMVHGQEHTDILIIGGGAGGTSAAIQAARMGSNVVVLEKTKWLGGMLTSAGVSAIDGNHKLPSGLWGEFRDSLYHHYGGANMVATGWVSHTLFEPSVGNAILKNMTNISGITIEYEAHYTTIEYLNDAWQVNYEKHGKKRKISAKVLIDATETGALLSLLEVPFKLGMDSRSETMEQEAPIKANNIVQDITYVAILKDVKTKKGRKGLVKKPNAYDASDYDCACKREGGEMFGSVNDCEQMLKYGKLPNDKYMINWPNCGNDFYLNWPDLSAQERKKQLIKAKEFTQGFVYYIQEELGFKNLRLAEEFPTRDHFPMIPYDREARRVVGKVFLTANHLENPFDHTLYRTGIAVGDYPIDHHHDKNPAAPKIDFINIKIPSYNVPLGALIPEKLEHFIVAEKNISVSNIVNGATRLQPVVLGIGQAAGTLAALSVKMNLKPGEVPIRTVQKALLAHKAYILPYVDVPKEDLAFASVQRIGATGILKGIGIPFKWANETWFYPNRNVSVYELREGLIPYYPQLKTIPASGSPLTAGELFKMIKIVKPELTWDKFTTFWKSPWFSSEVVNDLILTRRDVSVLIDQILQPFQIAINYDGTLKKI